MGILIIHADHDTTASEWERIRSLVASVADNGGSTVQSQPATSSATDEYADEIRDAANNHGQVNEKLHDPMGEYDDATWQSFSPQKRGSIKRHRNGNDAPFVAQAAQVPTPATNAMAELFAAAGLATPEPASVPTPEPTPEPPAARNVVDSASQLTAGQRTDLAIWANEKLADPKKVALVNAFLAGKVTATQVALYATKGGKSNLAKDMARVAKFDLVNA